MRRWEVITEVFWADGKRTQARRRCFTRLGARIYTSKVIDWKFVDLWNAMWPDSRFLRHEVTLRRTSNQDTKGDA